MSERRRSRRAPTARAAAEARPSIAPRSAALAWAALFVLVVAVYSPTVRADFVNWDDELHVTHNTRITEPHGLWQAWTDTGSPGFYPVTYTTWWVEWRAAGGKPWLFHLDNALVHAANAVLAGMLAATLGLPLPAAWLAAALWALHPVGAGTVAWVTERKNVLYVLFWLAALLLYVRARRGERLAAAPYAASVVCFALALLSKAAAMTLPAALVIIEWARGRIDRRFWPTLAPYVAVGLAGGLALLRAVPEELGVPPLLARLRLAGRALWFYVGAFLWPHPLPVFYPRWQLDAVGPWATLAVLVVAAATLAAWRRVPRAVLAGIGLFLSNAVMVIGLVWFTFFRFSYVSDHLAYLPLLGLAIAAVAAGRAIGTTAHLPDTVVHAALGLWCAALAAVTLAHLPVWHDSIALTSHALRYNPDCFVCHANYGAALVDRGDVEEGAPHLERAIALEPEARVLVQLGNVRLAQGRTEEAIAHYERALRLEPDDKLAHYNLGVALRDAGRAAEAVPHYRAALRVDPQWPDAHNNLGVAYRELGKDEAAAAEFDAVLRVLPDDVPANLNRAAVAAAKEDWTTAIPYYERALRADPASATAHSELGAALVAVGRVKDAIGHYEEAHRLAPDDADTASTLAWLRSTATDASLRDGAESVRLAELACALSHRENADHLDTLAAAYANAGRFADAERAANEALARAEPGSELAAAIGRRLALYRAQQPYREP